MKFLNYIHGIEGLKVILGAGFFWAWMDSLFMSALFIQPDSVGPMPEAATMAAFGFSIPFLAFATCKCPLIERIIANNRVVLIISIIGSVGSFLYVYTGLFSNWAALILGGICCGAFLAFAATAWGATYAHSGVRWATPFVAGSFACAIIIDAPLLCMVPEATAVFYSTLPVASAILYALVKPNIKTYPTRVSPPVPSKSLRLFLSRYLGISFIMLASVMLVKIGFGYLQHLISFSPDVMGVRLGGTGVQMARGGAALIIFSLLVMKPRISSALYRVGFLTMIAGIMMLPLVMSSPSFAFSEAAIISGYTVFDVFLWVAFSHIAYAQSKDPIKTIIVMRLISAICYVGGAALGMAATGLAAQIDLGTLQKTTVIGYFMVIATVLLLSSEDARILFRSTQTPANAEPNDSLESRKEQWLDTIGLTAREKEVAVLIMQGRTQPWISEALNISRNTVGTHMRHIYQKAGVHDRQQFIDEALLSASHTLRDTDDDITQPA